MDLLFFDKIKNFFIHYIQPDTEMELLKNMYKLDTI